MATHAIKFAELMKQSLYRKYTFDFSGVRILITVYHQVIHQLVYSALHLKTLLIRINNGQTKLFPLSIYRQKLHNKILEIFQIMAYNLAWWLLYYKKYLLNHLYFCGISRIPVQFNSQDNVHKILYSKFTRAVFTRAIFKQLHGALMPQGNAILKLFGTLFISLIFILQITVLFIFKWNLIIWNVMRRDVIEKNKTIKEKT